MNITWTKHAQIRQKEWQKKIGVTKQEVEEILRNSGQVVHGDLNIGSTGENLKRLDARAIFRGELRSEDIAVYWTSKVEQYWREREK